MNNAELETVCVMKVYREKIIQRINSIQNVGVLEYLDRFLELFIKKWGAVKYETGVSEKDFQGFVTGERRVDSGTDI